MKRIIIAAALLAAIGSTIGLRTAQAQAATRAKEPGLYATFDTSMGVFVVQLYEQKAPKTVENFVALAKGTKTWTDPADGRKRQDPLYDGLKFYNITPRLSIRTGSPNNTETGGPGFTIPDEITRDLAFDQPGRVAMFNTGPNTGGSQFMITLRPARFLDGKFAIFGQVVEGMEVVETISQIAVGVDGRPVIDVTIRKVTIDRVK